MSRFCKDACGTLCWFLEKEVLATSAYKIWWEIVPLNSVCSGCVSRCLFFATLLSVLQELEYGSMSSSVVASASSTVNLEPLKFACGVTLPCVVFLYRFLKTIAAETIFFARGAGGVFFAGGLILPCACSAVLLRSTPMGEVEEIYND